MGNVARHPQGKRKVLTIQILPLGQSGGHRKDDNPTVFKHIQYALTRRFRRNDTLGDRASPGKRWLSGQIQAHPSSLPTVTCCTSLLSESHRQTFFAGISTKSRELDASSQTGDSPQRQFSRKTHSILAEDIVMGEIY